MLPVNGLIFSEGYFLCKLDAPARTGKNFSVPRAATVTIAIAPLR